MPHRTILFGAALVAALVVVLLLVAAARQSAARRASLAAPGQPLAGCADARNCVSTESRSPRSALPPVPLSGSPADAQARARAALLAEPRTRIVIERPGYLRAEARSRILRFVDDVEIAIDADAGVIRFRSAARLGRGDFGVNRARMERVARRLRDGASA